MVNEVYLVVFVIYLAVVLLIGAWGYTRTTTIEDFWVYGRELGPWLATWSFVANFVSAVAVIGYIGTIYATGYADLAGITLGLMLGISTLYFAVDKIHGMGQVTLPDIIVDISGRKWAQPIAGIILLANDWVYVIMQLVGSSFLVTTITGLPYRYMIWVIGCVFILYTVLGGLISVAWTDLVQGVLMVAMIFVTFTYMLFDLGGLQSINTQLAAIDPAFVAPLGDGVYTPIGVVGGILTFFGTIFTGQSYIIRINATKDLKTAKIHLAAAGAILSVFYWIHTWLGGATSVALRNVGIPIDNVDKALPILVTEYLPTSLGAVVILAMMSAILSTTDTRLHATGVTTARDIYSYFAKSPSDRDKLRVSRISTIVLGLLAVAVGVNPPGTIIALYTFRAIILTSAFLIPVYLTLYWRGADGRAVIASMISGAITGVGWRLAGELFGIPASFLGVGIAFATLVIFSAWFKWSN